MLPASAEVEPVTSWSPVGQHIQLTCILIYSAWKGLRDNIFNFVLFLFSFFQKIGIDISYKFPFMRQFAINVKPDFLNKVKKNIINLLPDEFAQVN